MIRTTRRSAAIAAGLLSVSVFGATAATAAPAQEGSEAAPSVNVTDALGTHRAGLADGGAVARPAAAATAAACPAHPFGGGFDTSMGAGWTSLTGRDAPCRVANAKGQHNVGEVWRVLRESPGEFICRGRSFGYGSTTWSLSDVGWSWSGGTANPVWNKGC